MLKVLHTSDWHLGRSLYGRKRYDEFSAFLIWLSDLIDKEHVDVLLVAGDVFDTSTPSNYAQSLYYRFLCNISKSACRHVVIIAGNHDSPSFLNAPQELLRALNIYVVGAGTDVLEDEVITLIGPLGQAEAIICAVPYLRDRDIRTAEAGESLEDKNRKLIEGVQNHYAAVCEIAKERQKSWGDIPIIGLGHLFTSGGKTIDGDGVRDLYVGSLAHVGQDSFPECLDYLALGHLHISQIVGKSQHIRYSGSPIPMGYGEATQEKKVILVAFLARTPTISELLVPCFQDLERITGLMPDIIKRIEALKSFESHAWLEIEYTGTPAGPNILEQIDEAVAGSNLEVRRVKNKQLASRASLRVHQNETLDDLDVNDVFIRCLDAYDVPADERAHLIRSYQETLTMLMEEDKNCD